MSNRFLLTTLVLLGTLCAHSATIIRNSAPADTSQWIMFHTTLNITGNPTTNVLRIAADAKYWLWVNGEIEVREGALKRGPNPSDTYIDNLSLKHLRKGSNDITVMVWYWGRPGFSHRPSGCPGLFFDLNVDGTAYGSDASWLTTIHPSFFTPEGERPNFRLSESNIGFDARKQLSTDYSTWQHAVEVSPTDADWNNFISRPIPMWKDYGLKNYTTVERDGNRLVCSLPYNAQVTPYIRLKANAGTEIDIRTDNYFCGGTPNVCALYITRDGEQEYESPGWLNGHKVIYTIPSDAEVLEVKYRETGYDCDFAGSFVCDDNELNALWTKSQRTLYVTMRDNYMDCPDRERAQWIGDVTNELVETFYSLSPSATLLTAKCIREFADWQRADSVLFAPTPESNWNKELPMQSLAMVGLGTWNYYLGSADTITLRHVFPAFKRYMHKWQFTPDGTAIYRKGAWDWGDWGYNQDMQAMCQLWVAITFDYYARQCHILGETDEWIWATVTGSKLRSAAHSLLWDGNAFRHPQYTGNTDDRTQALAILAGIASPQEIETILPILNNTRFASPYMERYVLEAMCRAGYTSHAMTRLKERYQPMADSAYTTLWEIFDLNDMSGNGGNWSINHAWSGAPLIILSQFIAGITPLEPGFTAVKIAPQPCHLKAINATLPTAWGNVTINLDLNECTMQVNTAVPATIVAPTGFLLNDKHHALQVNAGKHKFKLRHNQ